MSSSLKNLGAKVEIEKNGILRGVSTRKRVIFLNSYFDKWSPRATLVCTFRSCASCGILKV